ncbi:MAG: hypothetical protein IJ557_11565 [Bacteroidaceae bacterium]|jgi:hypothetical protein|nr:hypothetical protein [Bacteroidaceae bacterium]
MKHYIVILICLCTTTVAYAQWNNNQRQGQDQQGQRREQWQQQGPRQFSPELFNQRLEQFVKNDAGLTAAECQKFFPLMHEMLNKQREINDKIQRTIYQGFGDKSENEYEQIISKVQALEIESRKLEQTYYKKFHTVLTWKKIYKVRFALSKWNMEVLKMFNPQQQQQPNRMTGWPQGQRNPYNQH